MSDNKTTRDGRDRSKVDINDPNEVEFLHRQFPNFNHQEIAEAVKTYGPSRKDIIEFLERKKRQH